MRSHRQGFSGCSSTPLSAFILDRLADVTPGRMFRRKNRRPESLKPGITRWKIQVRFVMAGVGIAQKVFHPLMGALSAYSSTNISPWLVQHDAGFRRGSSCNQQHGTSANKAFQPCYFQLYELGLVSIEAGSACSTDPDWLKKSSNRALEFVAWSIAVPCRGVLDHFPWRIPPVDDVLALALHRV